MSTSASEKASTDIERLDFVAQGLSDEMGAEKLSILLSIFAVLVFFLAALAEAPPRETNLARVAAVVTAVAALSSWLKPRLARFGVSIIFLTFAVMALISNDYSRTTMGWVTRGLAVACALNIAFFHARRAWRTAVIYGDSWKAERDLLQNWLSTLIAPDSSPEIFQFDSVSFWTGHFTYRLLKTDFCWVVAKFKRAKLGSMQECRVYAPDEVRQIGTGQAQFSVALRGIVIRGFNATPDMQTRLSARLSA